MQHNVVIAAIVSTFFISGCGKTLDFRNTEISNNTIYESGANTGFSGKVTNIPYTRLPVAPIGTMIKLITTVGHDESISEIVMGNAVAAIIGNGNNSGGLICDVKVKNGALHGDATCKVAGSKAPIFEMAFKENTVHGHTVIFSTKVEGAKLAEATFATGQLDGDLKIYSANGKIVIDSANFKRGLVDGLEEIRSVTSGKLIRQINYADGKQNGKEKIWSEDGTLLVELEWKEGKQTGFEKRFDESGTHLLVDLRWKDGKAMGFNTVGYSKSMGYNEYHLKDGVYDGEHRLYLPIRGQSTGVYLDKVDTYIAGKVQGKVINYGEDGKVVSTANWVDGQWVSTDPSPETKNSQVNGATTNGCVERKVASYHQERGEDALISTDILGEWEGECKAKI